MGIGGNQILIILLVIVILFGASKLPQIGKGMGEAIRNFKKSVNDVNEVKDAVDITPIASKKEENTVPNTAKTEETADKKA